MYVPPQALSSECDSCAEGGCHVDLTGLRNQVSIINLDSLKSALRRSGRISDCAILWNDHQIFAVVELKGGRAGITVDRVVEQLQESLKAIDSITLDQDVHDFYPLLMYRGPDPTRSLRGKRVAFRGIERGIIPRTCGSLLRDVPHLDRTR